MANITLYLLIGTIIAHLAIGGIVLVKSPYTAFNRLMLSLSVSVSLWAFSVLMVTVHSAYDSLLFWIRASHAFVVFLPWHGYAIAVSFPSGNPFSSRKTTILLAISGLLFLLCFTPFMVVGIKEPLAMKEPLFSALYIPFSLYMVGVIACTVYWLYKKLLAAYGLERLQMSYFLWGMIIFIFLATPANMILPAMGIWQLGPLDLRSLGPAFSLILVGTIGYAIVKYRFMDIRFAIRRNLAMLLTFILLTGVLTVVFRSLLAWGFLPSDVSVEVTVIIVALIMMFVLRPVGNRVQTLLDKYLFKKVTDYHASLYGRVRNLVALLDLKELLASLTQSIVKDMDLDHIFYSWKTNHQYHYSVIINNTPYAHKVKNEPAEPGETLISYLEEQKDILLLTDLKRIRSKKLRMSLEREMLGSGVEAVVPLVADGHVEGLLFLGAKASGEPFFKEDVQLLAMLSSQISVALKNARLYQDLLAVKQYLEEVLASMGNGLIAVNERGVITIFNSEAELITGLTARQVLGKKVRIIFGENLHQLFRETLDKGEGCSDVEVLLPVGKERVYLSCHTSLVEIPDSEGREVIMVLSDVTRIKELEKQKSQAQRLASLGEIAAGIAHEIKNPLVSIKTFAELLPDKYNDYEFRNNFAGVVSQEITRINDLVAELLNFVKEADLSIEAVELAALLDELVLLLSPQIEKQNITIHKQFPGQSLTIEADRDLLKQALLNVCVNAVHAMPDGGLLTIGLVPTTAALQRGGKNKEGILHRNENTDAESRVLIYIEDTGTGIPESFQDKVFDPFVTNKAEGIGIGLSISHKVVTAHGGQIKFSSSEDKGTRFEITLPQKCNRLA